MKTSSYIPAIPAYRISSQLSADSRTRTYRAIREKDRLAVVIKILTSESPSFKELMLFRNQYTISKNLNIPGIIRPLSLEAYGNGYFLVMEDAGEISLQEYFKASTLSLVEFLAIAIQLTHILQNLHQNLIIHKDIKPVNILIRPQTKQIRLMIDFNIASLLLKETQEIKSPNILEGTLAYMSPEQTGRMNRGIDYRSDFYSLGVTFYELLTGKLPFTSDDPMELVHCHLAKMPASLGNREEIPQVISDIVMKLMAKNAEDRYQSILGLRYDLENCLYQLKETSKIIDFEVAQRDITNRFLIPEKLYGRATEVATLLAAFERVANGNSEMMLVAGFSGIGKTVVVNEIHKPITRQQGYFIKGKFDQFNRNIPLSAFVQTLRDLMGQLLWESDTQLAEWKTKIIEAVGDNGQVLIEVIPELEQIIGKQPPALELSGTAAQNRFNLLFSKFIAVFTTKEHPLVIFLDDLQWADSASLQLIKLLMQNNSYLLLLGAYRDNEVQAAHPLTLMVEELKKAEKTVNTITLSPLGLSDTNQLIADTLHCTTERSRSLTELINRKTQGNPFFITQFLKALHEGGQITFNSEQGYWECDIAQINALSLTDNVVEFMAQQLQKLPNETKEVLKLAACIGNKFDLANLAVVWEQSQAQTATALWRALQEGLIIPQNQVYKFYLNHDQTELNIGNIENAAYRFLHDRVQQAAYNLIPEAQKQATHLKVGQLLLKNITVKEREQKIFDIVNQLNYGVQLITEPREKEELAWLNLSASSKARVSTAYTAATEYATFGIKLLKADCWQTQYQLALELHNLAAEAAYLAGKFELMAELIQTVLDSVSDPLDKTKVYEVKIEAYGSQNQALEAVCTGKEILQLLGIEFPDKPSDSEVKGEIIKTIELFNDKQIEDLIYLPLMADKTSLAAIKILSIITTFAYQIDTNIFILISLKQVSLSLQYGNSPYSSFAYGSYGIILCQLVKDVESGYRFGRLSVNLLSQFDTKEVTAKILNVFNSLIKHWREHIQETLQPLLESYSIGLETGDLQYASISIYYYHAHLYFLGQELGTLGTSTQIYINSLQKIKQNRLAHYIGILRQNILNLLGSVDDVCFLKGEAYDETVRLPISLANNDISELLVFYFYKLQLSYLFYKYDIAQKYAEKAEFYLSGGLAQVVLRQCYFYASLARLGIFLSVNEEAQAQLLNQVIDNQEKMEMWAKYCPMNVLHQYYLVEAEKNRVLGKNYEAGNWYDRAIAAAKENGYIQEEALANELAARFYLSWRREKLAADYMQEAYQCYTRWGAKAKLTHLEQQYPQLLQAIVEPTMTNFAPSTSSGQNLWLDLPAVMKAAQAISQEIELEKLLATLMHITIANAGAQIGHLALYQEGKWLVVAKADCQQVDMLEIPLEQYQEIPQSLIYVVVRTHQTAVFENLTDSAQFASDNYIITHHPKSVMCTPISRQGQLIGILYLENNLTVGAFTSDRIEILQLLTSQAAISVENARLYQQTENYAQTLETEVERKTQALNQKAQDLEQTLKQLQQTQGQLIHSEKMSSLGQMVAGIAHEINNPVSFIRGNITHLDSYIEDILRLLILYQQEYPQPSQAIQAMREEIDLDFLYEDVNQILESMKVGSERISQIVLSLRNFSRLDEAEIKAVDLHSGIQSTLLILQHRLLASGNQPEVRVIKEYGNIPLVNCYPSQLNQVFFNIIHNAIDAIRDNPQSSQNPEIRIRTEVIDNERLRIAISNTDSTIPVNLQDRIFDPFFTTKPVGRGKGLGLFVSYSIIQQHGGTLTVRSQIADGTEFKIVLPIR